MNRIGKPCLASQLYRMGLGLLLVSLTGCPGANPPGEEMAPPAPTAAELFRIITQDDPHQEWAQFPEAEGIVDSDPPHGDRSETFINRVVVAALEDFTGALSDDAIIVKRNI